MYSKTTIVGNLGRDPEMRYLENGDAVTNFSVATSWRRRGSNGDMTEETTWFRVSIFGKQAEACNTYLTKGSKALVEGRVGLDQYTSQDGERRASLTLRADRVVFLSSKGEGVSPSDAPVPAPQVGPDFEIPW